MSELIGKQKDSIVFQTPFFVVVSVALGLAAAVLRTIQIFNYIDFNTGFYSGPLWLSIVLNAIIILALILLVVMVTLDRNHYRHPISKIQGRAISIFALLMGMALIFYATTELLTSITTLGFTFTPGLIKILLQYLAAIGLMYMAVSLPTPNRGIRDLIHLFPCLWAVVVLVSMFLQHTIVVTVTENLYNLLRMIFVLLFFFFCAKYYTGYTNKGTGRWLVVSGCMVFVLGCITTFPLFLAHFSGMIYTGSHIVQSSFLDIALSIYALVYTAAFLSCRKKIYQDSQAEIES